MKKLNPVNIVIMLFLATVLTGCSQSALAAFTTTTPPSTPVTNAEVFARVAPSVAFIETPTEAGSGVLIEDGYIVTNKYDPTYPRIDYVEYPASKDNSPVLVPTSN